MEIKNEMVLDTYVNNNDWEMTVFYKGKKYYLYIEDSSLKGPSWDEWEKQLKEEIRRYNGITR